MQKQYLETLKKHWERRPKKLQEFLGTINLKDISISQTLENFSYLMKDPNASHNKPTEAILPAFINELGKAYYKQNAQTLTLTEKDCCEIMQQAYEYKTNIKSLKTSLDEAIEDQSNDATKLPESVRNTLKQHYIDIFNKDMPNEIENPERLLNNIYKKPSEPLNGVYTTKTTTPPEQNKSLTVQSTNLESLDAKINKTSYKLYHGVKNLGKKIITAPVKAINSFRATIVGERAKEKTTGHDMSH